MTTLYGRSLTRPELLRRVGRLDQVGGVRLVTLGDGAARGVRLLEFRSGSLTFDVLVDRAFDIGRCELVGVPMAWQASPGIVGPWYAEHDDWSWFRSWGGGLMVTCGLDHTLAPGEDSTESFGQPHIRTTQRLPLHGRVGSLPARLVGYGETWLDDVCTLWAEGEVLQAACSVSSCCSDGASKPTSATPPSGCVDTVENVGHTPVSHMLLYHCNLGYPLLDDGSRLVIPARDDHDELRRARRRLPDHGPTRRRGPGGVLRARAHRRARRARVPSALVNVGSGGHVGGQPSRAAAVPHRLADARRGGLRGGARAQHQSRRRTLGCP